MTLVVIGIYYLLLGMMLFARPQMGSAWIGLEPANTFLLIKALALMVSLLGIGLLFSAKDPMKHWTIILCSFIQCAIGTSLFSTAIYQGEIPMKSIWVMAVNHLIWMAPLAVILWYCLRAHMGVPPTHSRPLTIAEAAQGYRLSDGRTLTEASQGKTIVMIFLRHFGCTFTRQILRGLEGIQKNSKAHGAELVMVHLMQSGKETQYLGQNSDVLRIADPRCELYRAFGLGKGGFLELFGPRVIIATFISLFKGCGAGRRVGDGLQMPGAFLFRDGEIIASQPAHSIADLPDLEGLFQGLPSDISRETVSA